MKIIKTTDYDMFSYVEGNRDLINSHVNNLIESIQKKNLLEENPILVNEKFEIIDGQHRLEAAKKANVPVYYAVFEKGNIEDVRLLNAYNRSWSLVDFIKSYKRLGLKSYAELDAFYKKHRLTPTIAGQLLMWGGVEGSKKGSRTIIRDGEFEVTSKKLAEEFLEFLGDVESFCQEGITNDRNFHTAIIRVMQSEAISLPALVLEIAEYTTSGNTSKKVEIKFRTRDYLRQLEDICNFRKQTNLVRLF